MLALAKAWMQMSAAQHGWWGGTVEQRSADNYKSCDISIIHNINMVVNCCFSFKDLPMQYLSKRNHDWAVTHCASSNLVAERRSVASLAKYVKKNVKHEVLWIVIRERLISWTIFGSLKFYNLFVFIRFLFYWIF